MSWQNCEKVLLYVYVPSPSLPSLSFSPLPLLLSPPSPPLSCVRDFTRSDLPAGDPNDQAAIPDLSAYGNDVKYV